MIRCFENEFQYNSEKFKESTLSNDNSLAYLIGTFKCTNFSLFGKLFNFLSREIHSCYCSAYCKESFIELTASNHTQLESLLENW